MTRIPHLNQFLTDLRARPIEPGVFDCALFAADWMVACGHPDPAADLRGRYTTLRGARRVVRAAGFADLGALAASILPTRGSWMAAQPGDIALINPWALGVVGVGHVHVLHPGGGLGTVALDQAREVFAL